MVVSRKLVTALVCVAALVAVSTVPARALEAGQGLEGLFKMAENAETKRSWPELVGMNKDDAKAALERSRPDLHVFTLGPDRVMTMDYRLDRVRIFHDEQGRVTRPPTVG